MPVSSSVTLALAFSIWISFRRASIESVEYHDVVKR
jgi:hypothetical protein